MSSPSSSTPSSPRISPIARLRNARHVHERLQERKWTDRSSSVASVADGRTTNRSAAAKAQRAVVDAPHAVKFSPQEQQQHLHRAGTCSVDALAMNLQALWQKQHDQRDPTGDSLSRRIEKIGAREKDALVMHLLQRTAFLQAQRNDVVAVGEKLTTQLVQQQHELRVQFKAQTTQLQGQLEQAVHHHPEVARLEEKIAQLQEANRECEQKLLFAVQKLHRSRQRERALRREHETDPLLWDL